MNVVKIPLDLPLSKGDGEFHDPNLTVLMKFPPFDSTGPFGRRRRLFVPELTTSGGGPPPGKGRSTKG